MTQAARVLSKFNTMAQLSRALGHNNTSTVNAWKKSGHIHQKHHKAIMKVAGQLGVDLKATDFLTVEDNPA